MENIKEYPKDIVKPFNEYENANDEGAMHKSLLDLGESLLTYLVGVMFGEYKRSENVSEKLETELKPTLKSDYKRTERASAEILRFPQSDVRKRHQFRRPGNPGHA